jgi:hypothetical protein
MLALLQEFGGELSPRELQLLENPDRHETSDESSSSSEDSY